MRWLFVLAIFSSATALAETIAGKVVAVIDGDTLTVIDAAKKRHRVRLTGIDAPEAKQAFGVQSARALAQLCHGKAAKVEWKEKEGRIHLGQVTCADKDAGVEQVRRGMAWVSPKQTTPGSALYELEAVGRLRKVGLWADENPVPPWEWRSGKR
jgi:endonuclease YncB( thermonuclease family)